MLITTEHIFTSFTIAPACSKMRAIAFQVSRTSLFKCSQLYSIGIPIFKSLILSFPAGGNLKSLLI